MVFFDSSSSTEITNNNAISGQQSWGDMFGSAFSNINANQSNIRMNQASLFAPYSFSIGDSAINAAKEIQLATLSSATRGSLFTSDTLKYVLFIVIGSLLIKTFFRKV